MSDPLRPIPIQELKALGMAHRWQIEQTIAGLASLTPVRGQLTVEHQGTVLAVKGHAETIVTLCCDRCLQHFNHALQASADEAIWLGEPDHGAAGQPEAHVLEVDVGRWLASGAPTASDDSETCEQLNPRGLFDPEHWVFEQLSLQLPLVNHCGSECPGPATWSSDGRGGDPRWAALGKLKP